MRRSPTTALVLVAASLALAPAPALAEYCTGPTRTSTVERATRDVAVTPNRSIGPIALGMTQRQIRRAAGGPIVARGIRQWRVHGLRVAVQFGRYGRARLLVADSGRMTIGGVPLAAGPDAVQAVLPEASRSECIGQDVTLTLGRSLRTTGLIFPLRPGMLPRVVLGDGALRIR